MKRARRHTPFYIAALASGIVFAAGLWLWPWLALVVASNVLFAGYLALTLAHLPHLTAHYLRHHAASSDMPVVIIFLVTLAVVIVAVAGLFMLLNAGERPGMLEAVLTFSAVPLGWMTIHMMAAIHYAHLYWQPDTSERGKGKATGGLDFPGTAEPRGIDFVYFAFVIGMTAQTSDVAITTPAMRRINLVHAVVSFFFNTVLVAAAVNAAVALGN